MIVNATLANQWYYYGLGLCFLLMFRTSVLTRRLRGWSGVNHYRICSRSTKHTNTKTLHKRSTVDVLCHRTSSGERELNPWAGSPWNPILRSTLLIDDWNVLTTHTGCVGRNPTECNPFLAIGHEPTVENKFLECDALHKTLIRKHTVRVYSRGSAHQTKILPAKSGCRS